MEIKQVFEAAKRNDFQRVKFFIEKKKVPVNITNRRRKTLAHVAVHNENLDMLDYVLVKDPSLLTKTDGHDSTVLQLAVKRGVLEMVQYLVEKQGANVFDKHIRDYDITGTAVHRAIKYGHLNILRYFIERRKVDVNEPVLDQVEAPLFLAKRCNHIHIVKYLIDEAKATLTVHNSRGENILFLAVEQGDLDFIRDMLDRRGVKFDSNWQKFDGKTLVHVAVRQQKIKILKYLVEERKADVNIADFYGNTPLHCVALIYKYKTSPYKYFKYLIFNNADVNKKNKKGHTPYSLYCKTNRPDSLGERYENMTLVQAALEYDEMDLVRYLVKERHAVISPDLLTNILQRKVDNFRVDIDFTKYKDLIERGADPGKGGKMGYTILHKVATLRHGEEPIKYLLEKGCNINQKTDQGETPLHSAVFFRSENNCKYLIEQGADVNQEDSYGETPLNYAIFWDSTKIVKLLIKFGANINHKNCNGEKPLHVAIHHGRKQVCECLIELGADVNQKNKIGETPLQLALSLNHQDLFTYFAEHSAIIDDVNGTTIAHIAATNNQIVILNYLITKKNADVNALRNGDNWTPLHCAAFNRHGEIFRYLIEHGANIEAKDVYGKTPLQVVKNRRFIKSMEEILKKRSRRSVGEFSPISFKQSGIPNYNNQSRITSNIQESVNRNREYMFGDTCSQLQNFLTVFHWIFRNFYNSFYPLLVEKEAESSSKALVDYRMDPMVEKAINTLPEFKL